MFQAIDLALHRAAAITRNKLFGLALIDAEAGETEAEDWSSEVDSVAHAGGSWEHAGAERND